MLALLECMNAGSPVLPLLRAAAVGMQQGCGCGVGFMVALAGQLCSQCAALRREGLPLHAVTRGLRVAAQASARALAAVARPVGAPTPGSRPSLPLDGYVRDVVPESQGREGALSVAAWLEAVGELLQLEDAAAYPRQVGGQRQSPRLSPAMDAAVKVALFAGRAARGELTAELESGRSEGPQHASTSAAQAWRWNLSCVSVRTEQGGQPASLLCGSSDERAAGGAGRSSGADGAEGGYSWRVIPGVCLPLDPGEATPVVAALLGRRHEIQAAGGRCLPQLCPIVVLGDVGVGDDRVGGAGADELLAAGAEASDAAAAAKPTPVFTSAEDMVSAGGQGRGLSGSLGEAYAEKVVARLLEYDVGLLVTEGVVAAAVQAQCERHRIVVVSGVLRADLMSVASASGATVLSDCLSLRRSHVGEALSADAIAGGWLRDSDAPARQVDPAYGSRARAAAPTYSPVGDLSQVLLELRMQHIAWADGHWLAKAAPSSAAASTTRPQPIAVLLRTPSTWTSDELERAFWRDLYRLRNASEEGSRGVVPGGGRALVAAAAWMEREAAKLRDSATAKRSLVPRRSAGAAIHVPVVLYSVASAVSAVAAAPLLNVGRGYDEAASLVAAMRVRVSSACDDAEAAAVAAMKGRAGFGRHASAVATSPELQGLAALGDACAALRPLLEDDVAREDDSKSTREAFIRAIGLVELVLRVNGVVTNRPGSTGQGIPAPLV